MSITYDGTSIATANIVTRRAMHESSADRLLDTMRLTRRDGEIIVDDSLAPKTIVVEGVLVGSSLSDLETKIDSLKELCARKDKNLDISFAGGTRRYVCRMTKITFDRDFFNIIHVPYTIQFFVATGLGKDSSETTAKDTSGITATETNSAITFVGSYQPKPRHKITLTTRGNADVARISNQDTGDYIDVVLDGFSNGDYLEVDEENQTVKKNGTTNLNWVGKFPSVIIGANNLRLTILGSGYTVDQQQTSATGGLRSVIWDNTGSRSPVEWQSFIPSISGKVKKLSFYMSKDGSPGGNVLFAIHADNNGVPGAQIGTSWQEATSSLGAAAWLDMVNASTLPFLVAGTRYWIRNFSITGISGDDVSNFIGWHYDNLSTNYLNGKAIVQKTASVLPYLDGVGNAQAATGIDAGQFDFMFKEYVGDGGAASHTVVWQIYYTKKYL